MCVKWWRCKLIVSYHSSHYIHYFFYILLFTLSYRIYLVSHFNHLDPNTQDQRKYLYPLCLDFSSNLRFDYVTFTFLYYYFLFFCSLSLFSPFVTILTQNPSRPAPSLALIVQATLSDEAKEVYNSLVETPVVDTTTDTNPLRMLRSGLPIVRHTRSRGNKHHATLGHQAHSLSEEHADHNNLQFDLMHHSGAKTLPKTRGPPPPTHPPPIPTTAANRNIGRHYSVSEIENNRNRNNVDENPIPLPPRDRSKTLQPKSSLARHQRKHPLIIPGGGVTRTLAKVAAVTTPPCDEDQVDGSNLFQLHDGPVVVAERRNLVCNADEEMGGSLAPAAANRYVLFLRLWLYSFSQLLPQYHVLISLTKWWNFFLLICARRSYPFY